MALAARSREARRATRALNADIAFHFRKLEAVFAVKLLDEGLTGFLPGRGRLVLLR